MNQPLDSSFLFSAWAKGSADPSSVAEKTSDSDPFFGMAIRLDFSDNTTEIHYKSFDPYCRDWQYVQDIISPDKENHEQGDITITQATIAIAYDNNINTAYVDHVALRLGQAQTYAYDAEGNVDTTKLTGGGAEGAEYDEDTGDLTKYTAPNGVVFNYTSNAKHSITKEVGAGTVTDYTYDNGGYLTSTKYYADSENETAYLYTESELTTDRNHVASVTDSAGNTTTSTYVSGLPVTTTNAKGTTSTNTYYSDSRRLKSTYIAGTAAVNYTYDKGQVTQLQRKTYPYVGAPQEQAVYQTYNYDYNAWGQRTSVSVGNQILSTSEYEDVNSNAPGTGGGNKTKTTYGNGDSISYVYDKLDRLIKTVYNDSGEYVEYTYNGEGALSKLVHHQSNGTVIASYEFERDNLGRLIRSRQVNGSNATVQRTEHIYDAIGRISQQRWAVGSENYSESYTYNDGETGNGKPNTVTTATGDQLHYEYNDLQQLQYVRAKSANGTERFYNAYSYLNVSGDRTSNRVGFHNVRKADGSLISGFKYSYDALGNITKIAQSENNRYPLVTYSYDSLNQLVTETFYDGLGNGADHVTAKYTYTYDTAGNVRSISIGDQEIKTFTYSTGDWKDLLTSVTCGNTTHNLVYDSIGNPLTYGNGQQLYTNLTWEHGRQLASLTTGNKTYTFDYDADGIRTEKNGNGANHEYITQNGNVVREIIRSADWTRVLDFIYDNSGRPFALRYSYDGGNNFDLYYYVLNLQGDVVALLNSNGAVVARYTYNAWGEILSVTTDIGAPITDTLDIAHINPLRYRGYYYDTETGFYYASSRYYDPEICRFINADDVDYLGANGDFASLNLFAYCGNNPVSRTDSEGTFWLTATLISAAIGGIVSAVTDIAIQAVTTGTVDVGQTLIAAASGAISGACALIPGGKVVTTAVSGVINAGLNAGSYALNQWRTGGNIVLGDLAVNAGVGFVSGIAGNLFRYNSTSALKDAGEALIEKGMRKMTNGVANSLTSTIKRGFQYIDDGINAIYNYAAKAGTNSGFGSALSNVAGGFLGIIK